MFTGFSDEMRSKISNVIEESVSLKNVRKVKKIGTADPVDKVKRLSLIIKLFFIPYNYFNRLSN
jgi:hypothetical protein